MKTRRQALPLRARPLLPLPRPGADAYEESFPFGPSVSSDAPGARGRHGSGFPVVRRPSGASACIPRERSALAPAGRRPLAPGAPAPGLALTPQGPCSEKPPADTTRRRCENGRRSALRARAEAALPPGGGGRGPCAKAAALPRSPFAPWSVSSVMVPRPLDFLRKLKNASPSRLFSQRSSLIRTSSNSPGTFWNPLAEWKAQLAK